MSSRIHVCILGTRGIPNNYGGYEGFAEFLGPALSDMGLKVSVFNPSDHPYRHNVYKNVEIIRLSQPSYLGAAAPVWFDLLSLVEIKKIDCQVVLQLGSAWALHAWMKNSIKPPIITNLDGLEWCRSKWGFFTKKIWKLAEKNAVLYSDYLVADNPEIGRYVLEKYGKDSEIIAYPGHKNEFFNDVVLKELGLDSEKYDLVVARLEPENSIEKIIRAKLQSKSENALVIVGALTTKFGKYLYKTYSNHRSIRFVGGIYDLGKINSLRKYSRIYIHGHTVGGTNPSLVEAMSLGLMIVAHDNLFNRATLQDGGMFFSDEKSLSFLFDKDHHFQEERQAFSSYNRKLVASMCSHQSIVDKYFKLCIKAADRK